MVALGVLSFVLALASFSGMLGVIADIFKLNHFFWKIFDKSIRSELEKILNLTFGIIFLLFSFYAVYKGVISLS
jgi:hypothetical protein